MGAIRYKIINGTSYHEDTLEEVVQALERARRSRECIRIFYGDTENGRDWMEIYDTIGFVGRSCGSVKIPLLIKTRYSQGGMGILDHCIVKITIDKRVVYQDRRYHLPFMEIKETDKGLKEKGYVCSLFADGKKIRNCKDWKHAESEIEFYRGKRNIIRYL